MTRFRAQRLGDQLQTELAELIQKEVRDPRIGFVTVTEVRMSSDLNYARVYVSIMGDAEQTEESMAALLRAQGFLRAQIGRRMKLRHVPELRFEVDETLDQAEHIDALLRDAAGDSDGDSSVESEPEEGGSDG